MGLFFKYQCCQWFNSATIQRSHFLSSPEITYAIPVVQKLDRITPLDAL